jgi:transcription elongation factor Elf1
MMPKFKPKPQVRTVSKVFKCPNCNAEIETCFNGEVVLFRFGGVEFASCGGFYESVQVECPQCKGLLIFDKVELEVSNVG